MKYRYYYIATYNGSQTVMFNGGQLTSFYKADSYVACYVAIKLVGCTQAN